MKYLRLLSLCLLFACAHSGHKHNPANCKDGKCVVNKECCEGKSAKKDCCKGKDGKCPVEKKADNKKKQQKVSKK